MVLFSPKVKYSNLLIINREMIMKPFRINLQKLISNSKYLNEFSEALTKSENNGEKIKGFAKTFVASGKDGCEKPAYMA